MSKEITVEEGNAINEGNKLIASFMGFTISEPCERFPEWKTWVIKTHPYYPEYDGKIAKVLVNGNWEDASIPNFRKWDWLMPVVEKIRKICMELYGDTDKMGDIFRAIHIVDIVAVCQSCVQFIQWYTTPKSNP